MTSNNLLEIIHERLGARGIHVPEDVVSELAARSLKHLEERVGIRLCARLTEAELAELDDLVDSDDETGMQEFLVRTNPDYSLVVVAETQQLADELAEWCATRLAGDTEDDTAIPLVGA